MGIGNGLIVDGLGGEPCVGDVAVADGEIATVGTVDGSVEIDATGLLVTPGFIDLYTHYGGQAIWSDRIDLKRMRQLAREAIEVWALGFASSRFSFHKTASGERRSR